MHKEAHAAVEVFFNEVVKNRIKNPLNVLDVGSFDVNGSYRMHVEARKLSYTGIDIREGPNVDMVVDERCFWEITKDAVTIKYDIILCGQTLEHCKYPYRLVSTMAMHLKSPGLLFLAAPWVWPKHDYPDDLFRFSPAALCVMMAEANMKPLGSTTQECGPRRKEFIDALAWGIYL